MKSKKICRGMTAACLSAALLLQPVLAASPQLPAGWENPFYDVEEGAWYTPYVANLHINGIVAGYNEHTFGPADRSYNGQAVLMIVKAMGSGDLKNPGGQHWAEAYSRYAQERRWISSGDDLTDLQGVAKRCSVGRMAARALHLPIDRSAPSPYGDINDPYLTALYKAGIMVGAWEGGKRIFMPEKDLNRAELSTVVWNIMEYNKHIHFRDEVYDILPGIPAARYDRDLFRLNGDRMSYIGPGLEAVQGIDVSHHQDVIEWSKVARDGIDFAMIRTGYRGYETGVIHEDRQFTRNVQGAQAEGLDVGVYFFSQAITVEEAREEARFVLGQLKGYNIQGPVVFDWESIDGEPARTDGMGVQMLTDMANAFCEEVRKGGYEPLIYANKSQAYRRYDLTQLKDNRIWLAEYSDVPTYYYDSALWQYSSKGSVNGIRGDVDMDVYLRPVQ